MQPHRNGADLKDELVCDHAAIANRALSALVGSGTSGQRGTLLAEDQIERLRLDRPA